MKKLLYTFVFLALLAGIIHTASPPVPHSAQASSLQNPLEAAEELFRQMAQLSGKDSKVFTQLYRNGNPDAIAADFNRDNTRLKTLLGNEPVKYLVARTEDVAIVSFVWYEVAGKHPNTNMQSSSIWHIISNVDGIWKMDHSDDAWQATLESYRQLFPDDFLAAADAQRNAALFDRPNLMFADSTLVYHGCSSTEVKLAWQEEDKSVRLGIWLANGTGQSIYYDKAKVTLKDDKLGTILNLSNLKIDTIVPAGASTLVILKIPANQVKSGTKSWGLVNTNLNISYR